LSGIFLQEGFPTRFACGNDKQNRVLNPDAEHRGILLIKKLPENAFIDSGIFIGSESGAVIFVFILSGYETIYCLDEIKALRCS